MHHAYSNCAHNTSTGVQNEAFIEMTQTISSSTSLTLMACYKLVQKYMLASVFGAKSIVKIDYGNAAFTSSASAKV